VAEPRYLSACTRATTVFAILTVFFAVKRGLAFSVQAPVGSRGDADATIAACTKLIYETPSRAGRADRIHLDHQALYIVPRKRHQTGRVTNESGMPRPTIRVTKGGSSS
jgi:hypothetical protein